MTRRCNAPAPTLCYAYGSSRETLVAMAAGREYGASMNEPCTILIKLGARYTDM